LLVSGDTAASVVENGIVRYPLPSRRSGDFSF
jgi:hypothetical protein